MNEPKKISLYVVPTPIGNLEDITLRALRILKEVDFILAEDTRTTLHLLKHFEITKPLQSYHNFNEHQILSKIIARMQEGETVALVSDAGTPCISDPGFLIVRECLKVGLHIDCLPGATALIPALVKSGLPADSFIFEGFLPHKKGRKTAIEKIALETRTVILYESPHRLIKTLEQLSQVLGKDRQASVSRELTKIFEETVNDSLENLIHYFSSKAIKGEIVMVIAGKDKKDKTSKYEEEEDEE